MTAGRWAVVVAGAIAEPAGAQSRSAGEALSPTTPAQPPALSCPRRAGRMRGSRHPAKLRANDWNATGDEPERPHPRHPRLPDAGHTVLRHPAAAGRPGPLAGPRTASRSEENPYELQSQMG